MDKANPPCDPCKQCKRKKLKRNGLKYKTRRQSCLLLEGKTDDLPEKINPCKKCDVLCSKCPWRFALLSLVFEANAVVTEHKDCTMIPKEAKRYSRQYCFATCITHGYLGKRVHMKHTTCVEDGLHQMYPNIQWVDCVVYKKSVSVEGMSPYIYIIQFYIQTCKQNK